MKTEYECTTGDYKKFIRDMVDYLNDPNFIKTIYSVIAREVQRTGNSLGNGK